MFIWGITEKIKTVDLLSPERSCHLLIRRPHSPFFLTDITLNFPNCFFFLTVAILNLDYGCVPAASQSLIISLYCNCVIVCSFFIFSNKSFAPGDKTAFYINNSTFKWLSHLNHLVNQLSHSFENNFFLRRGAFHPRTHKIPFC